MWRVAGWADLSPRTMPLLWIRNARKEARIDRKGRVARRVRRGLWKAARARVAMDVAVAAGRC